ncbi:MAG: hypothetical protein ACKKL4_00425 [Patescibacteria group bacterium]
MKVSHFIFGIGISLWAIPMAFSSDVFLHIIVASAQDYECNIYSTNAVGCEAYADIKYNCLFPDELNEIRTAEAKTGAYTYPDFCLVTCAEQSGIPQGCRAGRVGIAQVGVAEVDIVVSEDRALPQVDPEEKTIIENAYQGAKLALDRFWKWLKRVSAGDTFELEPMSTPVAGVRG